MYKVSEEEMRDPMRDWRSDCEICANDSSIPHDHDKPKKFTSFKNATPEQVQQIRESLGIRDPARRKRLLNQIERLWEEPHRQDMRLMQLILNALASSHCRHILYNLEDFELEQALTNLYDNR